jgi:predicted nucleic acid-binding protein
MGSRAVIVDASFLVALWRRNDQNHVWAITEAKLHPPPWITCESVLSEADHLLAPEGCATLRLACRRGALTIQSVQDEGMAPILDLLEKYSDVPMSIADSCLVRLAEIYPDCLVLTTDSDFKVYRRFGRRMIPVRMP